jgi:hypothetical protein
MLCDSTSPDPEREGKKKELQKDGIWLAQDQTLRMP